jgi:hypothetical protein
MIKCTYICRTTRIRIKIFSFCAWLDGVQGNDQVSEYGRVDGEGDEDDAVVQDLLSGGQCYEHYFRQTIGGFLENQCYI